MPDSAYSRGSWGETGVVFGGLSGSLVGAVAFGHLTHRNGAANNTTGTVGGAIVGAGLLAGAGALVGLLIGSAIPR